VIYELRSYQLHPGGVPSYLDFFEQTGLPIISRYAELVGYFRTETGLLNRIVHLWRYRDRMHRSVQRAALLADSAWQTVFLPRAMSLLVDQNSIIMDPAEFSPDPLTPSAEGRRTVFELEFKWAAASQLGAMLSHECDRQTSVHPRRIGIWTAESGRQERVIDLYGFADEADRSHHLAAWRNQAPLPPDVRIERHTLIPTRFSPLQ